MKAIKNTIYTLCFCIAIITSFWALGYDNTVIHPRLSRAGIEIYGKNADTKLTQEQKSWIVEGSIAEDTDPRYFNHFYNPETGKGLYFKKMTWPSAKEWAQKQDSSTGDYSESAILENYRQGDYERAYQGIGHILHLIQDMSVPAHTRNDDHADGDPYEKWAEQNGDVNSNNASFIKIDNLNQAFDELASYSHNNFFSKDTISQDILGRIQYFKIEKDINDENSEYGYYDGYKIIKVVRHREGNAYLIDFKVNYDYWNLLYPKAVGYSAGVIDYFVNQFNQIDQEKREKEKLGWWGKTKSFFSELGSDTKYIWGDSIISVRVNAPIVWRNTKSVIKEVLPAKRVDQMAYVANIGQIATQTQSVVVEPPAEAQPLAENQSVDIKPKSAEVEPLNLKEVQPQNTELAQTQFKEVEPPTQKEVQPPIHAPYQWPAESVQSSPSTNSGTGSLATSGAITNEFQGQFNGSIYSSPATQNDEEGATQNDNAGEEAAPEAPQGDTQEQIDRGLTSGDLEVEPPTQEQGSSAEELPASEEPAEPDPVIDETPAESESTQPELQSEPEPDPQPDPESQPTTLDIQFYLADYNVRQMNFSLNWQDTNNIIQGWELEYRLGPNFGWNSIIGSPSTSSGYSYNFTAQYDNLTYYFRLRGQDASSTWTDWKNIQADISTNPVAINEIAWMGTIASSTDEWIELANKTDQEIDLNGWSLRESDGEPAITLTGKIAPNGFYLLERTNDDTIKNISADQIYAGALNDPQNQQDYGQEFILTDKDGNIIDKTKVAYSGQSNSNARIKISSERVSMWADGNNKDNWQWFNGASADAKDAGGNAISGTPKSKNSWADKYFSISSDIAKNTTLLKDRGTVKVLNNINISGATLNVEPGTILKFAGGQAGFNVSSGSILAKGTADNRIVFTSTDDNNYGINIGQKSPLYGDWGKINFGENTIGDFDNIIFKYSGAGTANPSIQGYKSTIKISNSTFDQNKYDILSVENSDINISSTTFKNSNRNGITISEGTSNISGNTFSSLANPGVGIYIKSQKAAINISNNQFSGVVAPIMMDYLGNFTIQDNQTSGTNSYNGILINSPSGYAYDEEIYMDSNMPYFMTSAVYYAGPKLKIAPGVIIKFSGGLYVQGDFEAIGTAEKPIVFTRIGDDSVGGASGSNGGSSPPSQWRTLQISGAANVAMDYFTIKHGGDWSFGDKCIKVFDGVQNFTFTNSTMTQCGRGLYSYTDNAQIENSVFSANSFNLESYAQTGHISNTAFGDTIVEMRTFSDYQQVSY